MSVLAEGWKHPQKTFGF